MSETTAIEATKYIRNEHGGVHSVDNSVPDVDGLTAYDRLHETTPGGNRVLPGGWATISEAEARTLHPQLFGRPDPLVRLNAAERKDRDALREFQDPESYEDQSDHESDPEPVKASRAARAPKE